MSFSLTILGSSSALPTSKRFPSAHVLEVHGHCYLVDCGEGTQIQLRRYKIKLNRLNTIFISHLHGDHLFGLFGLFSSLSLLGRKHDLHVLGPLGLDRIINFYLDTFGKGQPYKITYSKVSTRKHEAVFENKHLTVYSIPLRHRVPTTGYLFREKHKPLNVRPEIIERLNPSIKDIGRIKAGEDYIDNQGRLHPNPMLTLPPFKPRSYAYCSDTAWSSKTAGFVRDVDILYHEATFLEHDKHLAKATQHSTARQAAQVATDAAAKRLLIGHFSSRYEDCSPFVEEARSVFPDTQAAEDGEVYALPAERVMPGSNSLNL